MLLQHAADAVQAGAHPLSGTAAEYVWLLPLLPLLGFVLNGLLSLDEACSRYTLTVDEFLSWQLSIDQHGLAGLRTTRIQQYRQ